MINWMLLVASVVLLPIASFGEQIVLGVYSEKSEGQPIYFVFEGETFNPPKPIARKSTKEIDRSSPATVLQEYLGTVFDADAKRYTNLFAPGEIPESYLAPNSGGTELPVVLKAQLYYGDFLICVTEIKGKPWSELVKRVEGKYYLSEALNNKDRAYDLLRRIEFSMEKEASLNGMLIETLHPLRNAQAPHPMKIFYAGTNHVPAMALKDEVERPKANLKTPQGALAATYSASVANDSEWYLSLISPTELQSDQRLHRSVTNSLPNIATLLKNNTVAVDREIRFGNYAVFIFALKEKSKAADERSYLAFKNHEGRWYLTDELNGDAFVNFFRNAEINTSAAFPRIFLSP